MGISTEPKVTIIVVFGHSVYCAKEWVQCNSIIPDDIPVVLVENLLYPYPEITAWLSWGARRKPNWTLLSTMRKNFPLMHWGVMHGHALDYAMSYVHTKYVITSDSDVIIKDPSVIYIMVEMAEKENYAIVGWSSPTITLPYIFPFFALYRSDIARKYKFAARNYYPHIPEEFLRFWRKENEPLDAHKDARMHYMDVGQELYLRTKLEGLATYDDFNFSPYIEHQWLSTPYIVWENDFKIGHETFRRRLMWVG